ncbi:MAG: protein translocase subunit SecD [bacterium]
MQNRYPLWQNILLISALVIAIVYAMPNLFGVDQAVQISGTEAALITDDTLAQTKKILAAAHIKDISAQQQDDKLLVRFADTDTQIKARDIIKTALGEDYIVALNLASRTPKWLQALGANPMKLGLDLCGGVHFLLEVDLNDMIKKREDGALRSVVTDLREANIRYLTISRIQPHGMLITFRDSKNLDKGYTELSRRLQDCILTKITENNTTQLKVLMSEQAVFKVADDVIEQTMNTLNKRVNELGVSEAIVQRQGKNRISVDLPGIQDTARAKDIIGKIATLRFHMVDSEHDAEAAIAGDVPLGSKLYKDENDRPVLLKDQVILQGEAITYATATFSQDGRPAVSVHLGGGGESMFHRATAENIGKPMAIVYIESKPTQQIIDGKTVTVNRQTEKVISVATIQSALGNNFEITGLHGEKYAQNLALLLRSGALVANPSIIEEVTVGPSMGKANINKGILSIIVGYVFVLLFMMLYYRFFGLVANMALLLNLVFVVAILSILGATLTLPGIAGMVLTVGMAVDSNVLIYERIREELRNGISPQASIHAGYERAFTTIVDANVATLIVAMVLFSLGTGAVKSFAVVLTIGLMTSMLTAIVFTRAIVNLVYGFGRHTRKLSIGI